MGAWYGGLGIGCGGIGDGTSRGLRRWESCRGEWAAALALDGIRFFKDSVLEHMERHHNS